jgi:hypothetical protein
VDETGSVVPVDQPPGHGPYVIESLESLVGPRSIDSTGMGEKPQVAVGLFGLDIESLGGYQAT